MNPRNILHNQKGNALLAVLATSAVLAALSATALQMTGRQNRIAARQRNMSKQMAAAEGAIEYYYIAWKNQIRKNNYKYLNSSELAGIPAPVISMTNPSLSIHSNMAKDGVILSDPAIRRSDPWGYPLDNTNPNGFTSEAAVESGFPEYYLQNYPGWVGYSHFYRASIRALIPTSPGVALPVETEVRRYFQITTVPLFQCLAFFEEDLELHPGPDMDVRGKIHSNHDIWMSGKAKLRLHNEVTYAGNYAETKSPTLWSFEPANDIKLPWWQDDKQSGASTTKDAQLAKVSRVEPFGADADAVFDTTNTNPNDDGFREMIERPNTSHVDPPEIAQKRLYNKAGVVIKIDSSKAVGNAARVTVTGTGLTASQITKFTNAVEAHFDLYDRREGKHVRTTAINVAKLNEAITATPNFNGVAYIYDDNPNNGGINAIRLQNGAHFVKDTTIASDDPIYIQGDFNTGGGFINPSGGGSHNPNNVPSNNGGNSSGTDQNYANGYVKQSVAVIGDVVMILSNNWNDANDEAGISSRNATHTTVNAAIMTGFLPSDYNNNNTPGGGAHNLPRFLENWSGDDFTYSGSMVQIYIAKQYTGTYNTGSIFAPPNRRWSFDSQFLARPPAGAVNATVYSRGRWEHENYKQ